MFKKIIFLLIICSFTVCGFAKKNKCKAPKKHYFEMLINGENTPASSYLPGEFIHFDFDVLDPKISNFTYRWYDSYYQTPIETNPIKLVFPINPLGEDYKVTLTCKIPTKKKKKPIVQTLIASIKIDYKKTDIEVKVSPGGDITIPTTSHGDVTFKNVQHEEYTPWDTVYSSKGGINLVRWHVTTYPYIQKEYKVTSCGPVVWGDVTFTRPSNFIGDYVAEFERLYPAKRAGNFDTLKKLTVTITDNPMLNVKFDQADFCYDDNTSSTIKLETNFNTFSWKHYRDKKGEKIDAFTKNDPYLDITRSGKYVVTGYMDTTLYKALPDLHIVSKSITKEILVEDCPLDIPNIIYPENNEFFGIKKLNPDRDNELTLTDRNGKTVFQQKNYKCTLKNRKYYNTENAFPSAPKDGKPLPQGTYFYELKYDAVPEAKTYKGAVVILRN